ncbi:hypothetical protein [Dyella koreensis]|uniref:DUF1902 domain-containing protein n=1 Tax=Dyella koreensis TaxID=311235 RepID=A0ABW8K804_9GAMM
MTWSIQRVEDRDGHWVEVWRGFDIAERIGPLSNADEALLQEIQARMRIRLAHGPSALDD